MRIKEKLQHIIKNSLTKLEVDKKLNEIIIESSTEKNNGDYYTNIAITLAKDLHKKPEEIADILKDNIKEELIKIINELCKNNNYELVEINTDLDHVHLLIGLSPVDKISTVMKTLKGVSARLLNNKYKDEISKYLYGANYKRIK